MNILCMNGMVLTYHIQTDIVLLMAVKITLWIFLCDSLINNKIDMS